MYSYCMHWASVNWSIGAMGRAMYLALPAACVIVPLYVCISSVQLYYVVSRSVGIETRRYTTVSS